MAIHTFGPNAVDWEQRVDLDRLRSERLARLRAQLDRSELGALLSFDFAQHPVHDRDPHRHLGHGQADPVRRAARAEGSRWSGTSVRPPGITSCTTRGWTTPGPATPEGARQTGARAGISTLRGAFHPQAGIAEDVARKMATVLREHGLADAPLGVDVAEMPVLAALRAEGIDVVDGQQVFLEARRTKTADEISLLAQACADGRRGLHRAVRVPAAGGARERVRRPGQQGPLRPRQRVRRGGQRDLGRALLAAPARLQRPADPPRRPGVLRHPAQPPRLPHLLLPHVRGGQRLARAA